VVRETTHIGAPRNVEWTAEVSEKPKPRVVVGTSRRRVRPRKKGVTRHVEKGLHKLKRNAEGKQV